jgi:hypothetical protein
MKNIHVIPTSSPSKIFYIAENFHLEKGQLIEPKSYYHIYITNDEEIKEGDYVIWNGKVYKDSKRSFTGVDYSQCKKIILTTDQDLIADGVQAIDDKFLEWFVKNPSCEKVEVQKWFDGLDFLEYKIIIPQEEPKQETLEEADLKIPSKFCIPHKHYISNDDKICYETGYKDGAKWQSERMYSEEVVLKLLEEYEYDLTLADNLFEGSPKQWFEQFKKK